MQTTQLNTKVPADVKACLKAVSEITGIKIEELVVDGLKLLAQEADDLTLARAKMVRDTMKRTRLKLDTEHITREQARLAEQTIEDIKALSF